MNVSRPVVVGIVLSIAAVAMVCKAWSDSQIRTASGVVLSTLGVVKGVVRDADTGRPLCYATAVVMGTTCGAMTVEDGSFSISSVPPGLVRVKVMMMGYRAQEIDSVAVHVDRVTELAIALRPHWPESEAAARSIVGTEVSVSPDDLRCEIIPVGSSFRVGDSPTFRIVIHNISRKSFYLVRAIDGSDDGLRYPHVRLDVEGPGRVAGLPGVRCGNVNQLQPRDFVFVEPGDTFEPIELYWSYRYFTERGQFKVTFSYSTNAIDYAKWNDSLSNAPVNLYVIEMLKQVPRLELESSITVEVSD